MNLGKFALTTVFMIAASVTPALASDPVPSSADNFEVFGTVEDWTVYANNDAGTCLIERVDDAGNVIQMGLTKDNAHAYLGVFTLADVKIKKRQKIEILIDGIMFEGKAHGIKSKKLVGDYSGGYIVFDTLDVATAIAEGQVLIAFPKHTDAFIVDLTGTKNGMEEGRKCNMKLAGS